MILAKKISPPPEKRRLLTLLLDGILLFLALWGAVSCFSTAFSLQVRPGPLLLGCTLCALGSLVVFSLPRHRWVFLLLIALGWAWILHRLWDTLLLGEISLRCSVVNTFVTNLEAGEYIQPIAQLPDSVWLDACTALILMAAVPLALLLGLAVVRARSFCLTALFTLPFLAVPLAITITPAWLPLMTVLTCWGALLLSSLTVRGGQKNYDRMRLTGLSACALALALLTAAMPRETYRRPAWADTANDRAVNWAVQVSETWFPGLKLFGGGLAAADQHVNLADAGPLRYTGRTVLDVRSSDLRGPVYLRGFSSAVYNGTSWESLEDTDYQRLAPFQSLENYRTFYGGNHSFGAAAGETNGAAPSEELPDVTDMLGVQPMNFPALVHRETFPGQPYAKVTVRNIGAAPGYVYVPYHILTSPQELSGARFVQDAYLSSEKGFDSHTFYVMPACSPFSERGLSFGSDESLAERKYARFVNDVYLQVPEELSQLLLEWFFRCLNDPENTLPGGTENEHYQALFYGIYSDAHLYGLIRDMLAYQCVYDPDTPPTPEGEDFVAYFLTQSRRGYCMHFASAAALFLRAMGIPSRYVSGYVADIPASGRVQVPDSNAHAWVEVYISGYGWHPIEVTPAYAGREPGLSGGGTQVTAAPQSSGTPAPVRTPGPAATPPPTPTPAPQQAEDSSPKPWGLAASVLLALFLPFLRRTLARSIRRKRFAGPDTNRAVLYIYRYLERLSRRGGKIPPEVQALAEKARFSQHTLTEEERNTAAFLAAEEAAQLCARLSPAGRLALRYWFGLI